MRSNFPLFHSHLDLAHTYWKALLKEGDWVIDATCGNGKDTLKLAEILFENDSNSGVIAIDIQPQAIEKTKSLFEQSFYREKIHLFCASHEEFPSLAKQHPIRLIVYNLGYLPGSDKQVKTTTSTTLTSIRNALTLLMCGGMLSITCYPGHPEGKEEETLLLKNLSDLNPTQWSVCQHQILNRNHSPSLIIVQKKINQEN